jgi:hypothetical protein
LGQEESPHLFSAERIQLPAAAPDPIATVVVLETAK